MTVRIQPKAETDIVEAYWYYEGRASGLGERFKAALDYCLDLIRRHPRAYAAVEGEVRRGLLRKFPFGVWYVLEDDAVVVLAVLHTSRHPDEWRSRA